MLATLFCSYSNTNWVMFVGLYCTAQSFWRFPGFDLVIAIMVMVLAMCHCQHCEHVCCFCSNVIGISIMGCNHDHSHKCIASFGPLPLATSLPQRCAVWDAAVAVDCLSLLFFVKRKWWRFSRKEIANTAGTCSRRPLDQPSLVKNTIFLKTTQFSPWSILVCWWIMSHFLLVILGRVSNEVQESGRIKSCLISVLPLPGHRRPGFFVHQRCGFDCWVSRAKWRGEW